MPNTEKVRISFDEQKAIGWTTDYMKDIINQRDNVTYLILSTGGCDEVVSI